MSRPCIALTYSDLTPSPKGGRWGESVRVRESKRESR